MRLRSLPSMSYILMINAFFPVDLRVQRERPLGFDYPLRSHLLVKKCAARGLNKIQHVLSVFALLVTTKTLSATPSNKHNIFLLHLTDFLHAERPSCQQRLPKKLSITTYVGS
ncbi:hypothetical protein QW180_08870 [Vibrio sinaloensis]|nr:hypothetical protein [Vibrio sinaloensis]